MSQHYSDDVDTGAPGRRLQIAGRPCPGAEQLFVLLEEPGDPINMHFRGTLVPHFKRACPHCTGHDEPKPLWYVGAAAGAAKELVILELTWKCFRSAEVAARRLRERVTTEDFLDAVAGVPTFRGLLVKIARGNYDRSPRVLRCEQRVSVKLEWPYRTREELARIWGVPVRPRIYRENA